MTNASARTVQKNALLTLSICKHCPQFCTQSRLKLDTAEADLCSKEAVVSLGSQLQNIESLQTLHEFWSGFEPRCLLPLNAAVSPREEQPKGRVCFCLCLRRSWSMIDVMSSGTVLQRRFSLCLCRMTSGFVAALIRSTKPLKQTPERHMERVQVGSITHAARRP